MAIFKQREMRFLQNREQKQYSFLSFNCDLKLNQEHSQLPENLVSCQVLYISQEPCFLFLWILCISKCCHSWWSFLSVMLLLVLLKEIISATCNMKVLQNYWLLFFVIVYEFLALVYLHDDGVFISQTKYIGLHNSMYVMPMQQSLFCLLFPRIIQHNLCK